MEIPIIKSFKGKLKKMSLINLIFLLAFMISIIWLMDNLPEIIRFLYKTFFK